MLRIVLTVIQVIASAAIIGLVLLQRGKGADAGAGFGAGASGTVFGARGASTALSRATAIFAAIFMINSLALAYMGSHVSADQPKTILDEAASKTVTPSAPAGAPLGIPTSGSASPAPVVPASPATTATPGAASAPANVGAAPAAPAGPVTQPSSAPAVPATSGK